RLVRMHIRGLRRQDRTQVEQFMLHAPQDRGQGGESRIFRAGNRCQAHKCVQFIDGAVGFDTRRVLGDPLASYQAGFAGVASLGVDAIQRDARIVERFFAHLIMGTQKGGGLRAPPPHNSANVRYFSTMSDFIGPSAPNSSPFSFSPTFNLSSASTKSPTSASNCGLVIPIPMCAVFMSSLVYLQGPPLAWQI